MRIYVVRHRGIADPGFSGVLRDYLVALDEDDPYAETACYRKIEIPPKSHIGFHQYRRTFLYPFAGCDALVMSAQRDPWRQVLPVSAEWLGDYNRRLNREFDEVWEGMASRADILVPRPLHLGGMTMGQHYASAHDAGDWEIFASLLRAEGLDDRLPYLTAFNMFVMRTELFTRYMQVWRRVMDRAAAKIIPPASGPQRRVFGFLSERLFTAWLYKMRCDEPGLVVESLPVLVAEGA